MTNGHYEDRWAERISAAQRLSVSTIAIVGGFGTVGYIAVRLLDALVAMCHALEPVARAGGG